MITRSHSRLLATLLSLSISLLTWDPALARPAGSDPELPGEILVRLRSADALPALLEAHGLRVVGRFGTRPIYRLIGSRDTKDTLGALQQDPAVLIAEPNSIHSAPEARRNSAWAIGEASAYVAQWAPAAIGLPRAHAYSRGGGTLVAVIDTGVDTTHPALLGRLANGYDFVDDDADPSEVGNRSLAAYGHGTHVAGLIALVAPEARILPIRALDSNGNGNTWVLADAVLHALDPDGNPGTADGADVVNFSLGTLNRTGIMQTIATLGSCAFITNPAPDDDFSDPGYADDETRCSGSAGAVFVAAAGNDGSDRLRQYPAAENAYGLLGVAASTADRRLANFSNFGGWLELAAPGTGITSAVPASDYATWSGTSMAAPWVAGTAALLRAQDPSLSGTDIARRIVRSTRNLCGTKLRALDAAAALADARGVDTPCR